MCISQGGELERGEEMDPISFDFTSRYSSSQAYMYFLLCMGGARDTKSLRALLKSRGGRFGARLDGGKGSGVGIERPPSVR